MYKSFKAGTKVKVSAHTCPPGKGLNYPEFIGFATEESITGTWDVTEVKNSKTNEIISVYGFSIKILKYAK